MFHYLPVDPTWVSLWEAQLTKAQLMKKFGVSTEAGLKAAQEKMFQTMFARRKPAPERKSSAQPTRPSLRSAEIHSQGTKITKPKPKPAIARGRDETKVTTPVASEKTRILRRKPMEVTREPTKIIKQKPAANVVSLKNLRATKAAASKKKAQGKLVSLSAIRKAVGDGRKSAGMSRTKWSFSGMRYEDAYQLLNQGHSPSDVADVLLEGVWTPKRREGETDQEFEARKQKRRSRIKTGAALGTIAILGGVALHQRSGKKKAQADLSSTQSALSQEASAHRETENKLGAATQRASDWMASAEKANADKRVAQGELEKANERIERLQQLFGGPKPEPIPKKEEKPKPSSAPLPSSKKKKTRTGSVLGSGLQYEDLSKLLGSKMIQEVVGGFGSMPHYGQGYPPGFSAYQHWQAPPGVQPVHMMGYPGMKKPKPPKRPLSGGAIAGIAGLTAAGTVGALALGKHLLGKPQEK